MFFLKLSTALLSLASSVASAAPAKEATPHGLAKRADGSSRAQAKNAVFDIDGWLNIAEINCYIMLCFMGGNRIFQRQPNQQAADQAYSDAGAESQPFRNLDQYGTTRASDDTTSPEDFPWRSIQLQQGELRYLVGVFPAEQLSQGGSIVSGYKGEKGGQVIEYNEWFEIDFLSNNLGEMCNALFAKDFSKCGKKQKFDILGQTGLILAGLVYFYTKSKGTFTQATIKGSAKRGAGAVQWELDPETIQWAEATLHDEKMRRGIADIDQTVNEILGLEKRGIVELDEAGNELSSSGKRGIVELDEAGNELSSSVKRGIVELDEAGNELPSSVKRGIVELDEAGNELSGPAA